MKCIDCDGTGKPAVDSDEVCSACNGSGEVCDSCCEAMTTDDIDLGTGSCQQCEDERNEDEQASH